MTRRVALKWAATTLPVLRQALAAHGEFWNFKDPVDWTEKETNQILTHSPWAKQASVETPSQRREGATGMPSGGGMGRSGGGSTGGMGPGMGGSRGMGAPSQEGGYGRGGGYGDETPQIRAVVRWESAIPVSAALKKGPPDEAAQSYIITVTGLPKRQFNPSDDERMAERIKQSTSLERKGKDPISPARVQYVEDADSAWRFSFSRSDNPITADDKEVIFVTRVGQVSLKAKFPLKEMTYKDRLAL